MLAVSSDTLTLAVPMAAKLGLHFPVLSDPQAQLIHQYRMLNPLTNQAHMGYVLIDASGRVRARELTPPLGRIARSSSSAWRAGVRRLRRREFTVRGRE